MTRNAQSGASDPGTDDQSRDGPSPRSVQWYPRTQSSAKIETKICSMTDGIDLVVAVEVFDHPDAKIATHGDAKGLLTGPWCLGPLDDVKAELSRLGHVEWSIQATAGMGRENYEGEA